MKLTPLAKVLIAVVGLVVIIAGVRQFAPGLWSKVVPSARTRPSVVPKRADLPEAPETSGATTSGGGAAASPAAPGGCTDKPEVRMLIWAWNAQSGLMLANGGPHSARGSLMCDRGVNLRLVREDMVDKMQEGLVAFATALKRGEAQPDEGAHFVAIMGDGAATFLRGLNSTLERLGPEYTAKVVGSCGYSRGEDRFMGPPEWKADPRASKGGVTAGVLRDGDWNIVMKWLGDNGLCNNPDEKTWDADCMNWVAASDYIDAAQKYVAGYCEDRPVVRNGQRTGETKRICVQAVTTWTPGDVTVAHEKGGLASIVSTKEYSSQMPNTIIGIDKWMKANRGTVEGCLAAIFDGSDRVKASPQGLRDASVISQQVYHEAGADPAYWEKYFRGVTERDKQGLMVELGGSSVNNLADNLVLFGLAPGSSNLFAATYSVFGDIVVEQYPDLVPDYPPVARILDTSYLQALAKREAPRTAAEQPTFAANEPVKTVVSRKSWQINFESGSATLTSDGDAALRSLLRDLLVASAAAVEVHGHTDGLGTPLGNMALSEARAFAVKEWLERNAPANFPEGRVRVFSHGQENPVAPNATAEGRARNRRVDIVIGTTA